jgi:hypothetical protein
MADYGMLLRDHVTLTCRSIDRLFLQAYVPGLQSEGLVCRFLVSRGYTIPSSAAFGQIGERYVAELHRWASAHDIPVIQFRKGDRKEDIARPLIDAAAREGGEGRVVLLGIAQEKASVWRSWKAKGTEHAAHPHMAWGRQMAFVNHFYLYLWDPEWGPAFWKTNAYAPYPVWLWLNGHEWAKRQLTLAGIGYQALDNGFRSCDDPAALQRICNGLGPSALERFLVRWQARLPSPFTPAERETLCRYELAFRQFEVSDTRVFDRPASGRMFFEAVIRDHLHIGRPDPVALLFDRRITHRTPGTFRTRVITEGVDPQLSCYYRASRLKQYFKEHRALRTETVIGDTHDFGIGRRVCPSNWSALRAVGEAANARLADAQAADARPAPDVVTFEQVTRPSRTSDGLSAPGLRFGDPRVMALLAALLGFGFLIAGFTNRALRERVAVLLGATYTARQMTYDLRRLRRKGLIARLPGRQRYMLTPLGRRVAVLFVKTHGRVLATGLIELNPTLPAELTARSPLAIAWRRLDTVLEEFTASAMIAA